MKFNKESESACARSISRTTLSLLGVGGERGAPIGKPDDSRTLSLLEVAIRFRLCFSILFRMLVGYVDSKMRIRTSLTG